MALTYSHYLKLDRLLELQEPHGDPPEHDEMLFIVIHQVYELWFKQLVHEADRINRLFSSDDLFGAVHSEVPVDEIEEVVIHGSAGRRRITAITDEGAIDLAAGLADDELKFLYAEVVKALTQ